MEFAEQERRPEQVVTSEYRSVSPEGADEAIDESSNGVNYSKVPKALQNTPVFGELPALSQEKAQGRSNEDAPVAKAGKNSDSAPLGGTVAPPVLIAGGLGGALPAPAPNPWQGAAETFGKGAAAVGRGAAALGRFGVVGGLSTAIWGGPLAQPAGKGEMEWLRRNAARQQVLQSTQDHGGGKNAQHGKAKAQPSKEQQLRDNEAKLEELKRTQGSKKEKIKAERTIENLKKEIAKDKKGEFHSGNAKGSNGQTKR